MKKIGLTFAIFVSALTLQSCSMFGVGEEEFSCPGRPDGVHCKSVWDVYHMTNGNTSSGSFLTTSKISKSDEASSDEDEKEEANSGLINIEDANFVVDNYVTPRLPNESIPIRTPASVMRIWYAPYDDVEGDFIVSGYAYTEVEPRRWTLGNPQVSKNINLIKEPLKTK